MEKLVRSIEIFPAYDKRNIDPEKNYGIHGVDIKFLLKGKKGVIQFVIYTNWHLKSVEKDLIQTCKSSGYCFLKPLPADIGYHAYKPQWDGQEAMQVNCKYLDGKPCYYDGSSLQAEEIFNIMVEKGHEVMWEELEKWYKDLK